MRSQVDHSLSPDEPISEDSLQVSERKTKLQHDSNSLPSDSDYLLNLSPPLPIDASQLSTVSSMQSNVESLENLTGRGNQMLSQSSSLDQSESNINLTMPPPFDPSQCSLDSSMDTFTTESSLTSRERMVPRTRSDLLSKSATVQSMDKKNGSNCEQNKNQVQKVY